MTKRSKPPIVSPFDDDPFDLEAAGSPEPPAPPAPPPPPPWDPQEHPIAGHVVEYTPGKLLAYEQGGGYGSATALLIASLIVGWLTGVLFQQIAFWVTAFSSVCGFYILLRWKSGEYHSIYWRIELDEMQLKIHTHADEFVYDLHKVSAVAMTLETQENSWSSTLAGSWRLYSFMSYNAQVMLQGLLEDSDLVVAETGFLQRDKAHVHHMGRCLGHMLAVELDVPFRDLSEEEAT